MPPSGPEVSDLAPLAAGAAVLITGAGVTGRAVLAALAPLGVRATLCDDDSAALRPFAEGGIAVVDPARAMADIGTYALVVTSPGFPPSAPVLAAAAAADVPIWGDVELAWRLDRAEVFGPP
ncbi:MAG TPA: UDP-N-acetylmuramoyl-L-alanine--D-glutamate ligase, partial [Mycobacterium sp.]|nr:UDP-N-acetylmuramoyl-L-alanine--D-glutamate ligase [Mycobacterium sp.]